MRQKSLTDVELLRFDPNFARFADFFGVSYDILCLLEIVHAN